MIDGKLHRILPELEEIGFSIYKFSHLDYKIDAIPNWISPKNAKETIFYLISEDNDITNKKYVNDEKMDKTAKIVSKFVNAKSNIRWKNNKRYQRKIVFLEKSIGLAFWASDLFRNYEA